MNFHDHQQISRALAQEPLDLGGLLLVAKQSPSIGLLAGLREAGNDKGQQLIAAHYLRGFGWPTLPEDKKQASRDWLDVNDPITW